MDAEGNADKGCEASCAVPSGGALLAERMFQACRAEGAGATCTCGQAAPAARAPNAFLEQTCAPGGNEPNGCTRCEAHACCATSAACAADAACVALGNCTSACGKAADARACEQTCARSAPEAARVLHAQRWACLELRCGTPDTCGVRAPDACVACTKEKCANEFLDCYGSPGGREVAACAERCAHNAECVDICLQGASSDAQSKFIDFNVCGRVKCAATCGTR